MQSISKTKNQKGRNNLIYKQPNQVLKLTVGALVRYAWLVEVPVLNQIHFRMNSVRVVHVASCRRRSLAPVR